MLFAPRSKGTRNKPNKGPLFDKRDPLVVGWRLHAQDMHRYPSEQGILEVFACATCKDWQRRMRESERWTT
jgi:hypothetical protein